eukprot:498900-Prymnesium_polylepis.1
MASGSHFWSSRWTKSGAYEAACTRSALRSMPIAKLPRGGEGRGDRGRPLNHWEGCSFTVGLRGGQRTVGRCARGGGGQERERERERSWMIKPRRGAVWRGCGRGAAQGRRS